MKELVSYILKESAMALFFLRKEKNMVLEYWIWKDEKWVQVSHDEFYEYDGYKEITGLNRRGSGWRFATSMLCELAGRHLA